MSYFKIKKIMKKSYFPFNYRFKEYISGQTININTLCLPFVAYFNHALKWFCELCINQFNHIFRDNNDYFFHDTQHTKKKKQ